MYPANLREPFTAAKSYGSKQEKSGRSSPLAHRGLRDFSSFGSRMRVLRRPLSERHAREPDALASCPPRGFKNLLQFFISREQEITARFLPSTTQPCSPLDPAARQTSPWGSPPAARAFSLPALSLFPDTLEHRPRPHKKSCTGAAHARAL